MLPFLFMIDTPEESELCEALYFKHRDMMFRIARSYLRSDQDAEDVVQTVFCEVAAKYIKRLLVYNDDSRRRFLYLTAKHRALNLLRKNSPLVPFDEAYAGEADGALDYTDEEFIDAIQAKAEYARLMQAMDKLDPDDKALLWMRFGIELTTAEIADSLGEKSATITKRLQRAKKKLAAILLREGGAA